MGVDGGEVDGATELLPCWVVYVFTFFHVRATDAKINDTQGAIVSDSEIIRLDVSMYMLSGLMEDLNGCYDVGA